jgi:hypothetical protein
MQTTDAKDGTSSHRLSSPVDCSIDMCPGDAQISRLDQLSCPPIDSFMLILFFVSRTNSLDYLPI